MPLKTKSSDYPRKSYNSESKSGSRTNSRSGGFQTRGSKFESDTRNSDSPRRESRGDSRDSNRGFKPRAPRGDSEGSDRRSFGGGDRRSFGGNRSEGGDRSSFGGGDRRSFGGDRPRPAFRKRENEGDDDNFARRAPRSRDFSDSRPPRFGDDSGREERPARGESRGFKPRYSDDRGRGDRNTDKPRGSNSGFKPRYGDDRGNAVEGTGRGFKPRGSFERNDRPRNDRPYNDRPRNDKPRYESEIEDFDLQDNSSDDFAKNIAPNSDKARVEKDGRIYLYGWHVVRAVLMNPARRNMKIFATDTAAEKFTADEALQKFSEHLKIVSKDHLEKLCGRNAVHQGIAILADPLPDMGLERFLEKNPENYTIIALDQVQDPHNIGAIIRSSAYLGATAVVVVDFGTPEDSSIIAKAASGALEMVPVIRVKNLRNAIEVMKKHGAWIYGFGNSAPNTQKLNATNFDKKSVLLFGAEGKGLRLLSQTHSDFLIEIDALGDMAQLQAYEIDSLNVSNAVALALYQAAASQNNAKQADELPINHAEPAQYSEE